jgi:hypothetical protein
VNGWVIETGTVTATSNGNRFAHDANGHSSVGNGAWRDVAEANARTDQKAVQVSPSGGNAAEEAVPVTVAPVGVVNGNPHVHRELVNESRLDAGLDEAAIESPCDAARRIESCLVGPGA